MSSESLERFWKKVETDPSLRQSLEGLFQRNGGRTVSSAAAIVDLGAKHGFTFTAAELKEHLVAAGPEAELADAELGAVTGGAGLTTVGTTVTEKILKQLPGSSLYYVQF